MDKQDCKVESWVNLWFIPSFDLACAQASFRLSTRWLIHRAAVLQDTESLKALLVRWQAAGKGIEIFRNGRRPDCFGKGAETGEDHVLGNSASINQFRPEIPLPTQYPCGSIGGHIRADGVHVVDLMYCGYTELTGFLWVFTVLVVKVAAFAVWGHNHIMSLTACLNAALSTAP